MSEAKDSGSIKPKLHARNRNNKPYDFKLLIDTEPLLGQHISFNKYGAETIDFFSAEAVKLLQPARL